MNVLNKITWRGYLALALVFMVGTILPACVGQWIDAPPPRGAIEAGIPADLSLDESIRERNDFVVRNNAIVESWDASIQAGEDKAAVWTGIFSQLTSPEALVAYGLNPASGGITALLFGAGLFFRRPGDVTQVEMNKEKRDSYNAGIDKGKA